MGEKLTRRALDNWLKASGGPQWIWCGELRGLGLRRRSAGGATFVVQFRVGRGRSAQKRRVTLGTLPAMTLDEARERAAEYVRAGWRGTDLVAETKAAQASNARRQDTLSILSVPYLSSRRTGLRPVTADMYASVWRRLILPRLGSRPASEIKRREVAALMDHVEEAVGSSVADRVFEQLSVFFDWYAARDDDFTSPLSKQMKRHRKGNGARPLTDSELRSFWIACGDSGLAGGAGRFCLLTASRRTETLGAAWSEVAADVWTIPAVRYKTRREHVVPLADAALSIIRTIEQTGPLIFKGTASTPQASTYWAAICDAGGPKGDGLSWHSLRKTARTLMARAGVRAEHAERALGHVQGAVERAYDKYSYLPEKRIAFDALAAEIARAIDGRQANNVIRLAS